CPGGVLRRRSSGERPEPPGSSRRPTKPRVTKRSVTGAPRRRLLQDQPKGSRNPSAIDVIGRSRGWWEGGARTRRFAHGHASRTRSRQAPRQPVRVRRPQGRRAPSDQRRRAHPQRHGPLEPDRVPEGHGQGAGAAEDRRGGPPPRHRGEQGLAGREAFPLASEVLTMSIARDALRGAVAGAAATWLMDRLTTGMLQLQAPAVTAREEAAQRNGKSSVANLVDRCEAESALTVRAKRPPMIENAVHYLLGIVPGAIYGVVRRRVPF